MAQRGRPIAPETILPVGQNPVPHVDLRDLIPNLREIVLQTADEATTIQWLTNKGLIANQMMCTNGHNMRLHNKHDGLDEIQAIGLLKNYKSNDEQDINYLLKQALSKVAFLPWGYLMDRWRWEVFDGSLPYDQWNKGWWDLRFQLQGLSPPTPRPANAFDPTAKSHIDNNVSYIRYFVAHIVQFQFYQTLCQAANHTGPLYKCDFYNNDAAGTRFANMLSMGSSQPWPKAMQRLTGQQHMDARAIKEYFQPLTTWLAQQNKAAEDCYGWGYEWPKEVLCTLPQPRCGIPPPDCTYPPPSTATHSLPTLLLSLISFTFTIYSSHV